MKMEEIRQTSAAREAQLTEARDDVLKYAQEKDIQIQAYQQELANMEQNLEQAKHE